MDIKLPIGNNLRTDGPSAGSKPRGSTPSASEPTLTSPKGAVGESVTLTETAKTLSAVRGGAQDPPFNSVRVAEIKAALAEGRYEIDSQRLARRMLEFEGAFA
ncbi:flagellar biosynthesis anti-sigma factor FlgM [Thermochromatium tepidum]|jgi:Negative regulator of flagellin synthesis (anti-sigma28 factor)|uniref:Negative regulator of flagellin synthesis n=1 Tax=Thermochromatium tepidum ATCC 43061 TaxID=316276 RepID=A0A6I6ECF1_THETI|nr:flagellar biosynthesis anti-sigma factor FlgM [Thermochromatium tepidum]QGU33006.1 flagellar biosynthesis anti-sigma factor FlgM [Thermochromatium tepidum ATCC 43061]